MSCSSAPGFEASQEHDEHPSPAFYRELQRRCRIDFVLVIADVHNLGTGAGRPFQLDGDLAFHL